MVSPSLELSETDSLHLSGISQKPLFIWLSGTFEQFWYMPSNSERWMVSPSLELSKTDSLHLSGISHEPLFIWLVDILNMFWYMPPIPKDRCFFRVWSCPKPTLYLSPKSPRSRVLYDLWAFEHVLTHTSKPQKTDAFFESEVVKNHLFTPLPNLPEAACYMTCSHFEHVLIYASKLTKDRCFFWLRSCQKPTLIFLRDLQKPLVIWLVGTFEQMLQNLERWTSFANTGVVKDRYARECPFSPELRWFRHLKRAIYDR